MFHAATERWLHLSLDVSPTARDPPAGGRWSRLRVWANLRPLRAMGGSRFWQLFCLSHIGHGSTGAALQVAYGKFMQNTTRTGCLTFNPLADRHEKTWKKPDAAKELHGLFSGQWYCELSTPHTVAKKWFHFESPCPVVSFPPFFFVNSPVVFWCFLFHSAILAAELPKFGICCWMIM